MESNENNKQLIKYKSTNLNTIKELRRQMLNEFYTEMKHTADRIKTNEKITKVSIPIKEFRLLRQNKVEIVPVPSQVRQLKMLKDTSHQNEPQNTSPSRIPRPSKRKSTANKTPVVETDSKNNLHDLKDKIIKRKFGYLWLRKTFGRVLPSEAEKHFQICQTYNNFQIWKTNWWLARKEWRLNIKAECYHNYTLYKLVWTQWRSYVIETKRENRRMQIAINHHSNIIKRKFYTEWKSYSSEFKTNNEQLQSVIQQNNDFILRYYYEKWTSKYQVYKYRLNQYREAITHFNSIELTKYYQIWKTRYFQMLQHKRKLHLAISHYRENLLIKCFNSFIIYKNYRKKKNIQKQKLDEYYDSQLVYRVYHTWLNRHRNKLEENAFNEQIAVMQNRFLLAHFYEEWKYSLETKRNLEKNELIADRFRTKHLKLKYFSCLKLNHNYEQNKAKNKMTADSFHLKWIKKRFYIKWQEKHDEKEEIRYMHLAFRARRTYETNLMKAMYAKWLSVLGKCVQFNTDYRKADDHYNQTICKAYLKKLREYRETRLFKKSQNELALNQCNYNTYYRVYSKWYKSYIQSIDDRMNSNIAILHVESKTKLKFYTFWKEKFELRIREYLKENEMAAFYENKLKQKTLNIWKMELFESKREACNEATAYKHRFIRSCKIVFESWKQFVNQGRVIRANLKKAENFYKLTQLKLLMANWRLYTKKYHEANLAVQEKIRTANGYLLSDAFQIWRNSTKIDKVAKINENIAQTFYLKNLLLKILKAWNNYTTDRIIKQYHDLNRVELYQQKIQKILILKFVFSKWSSRTMKSLKEKNSDSVAQRHYNKQLKQKLFLKVKLYTAMCKRKHMLKTQADYFNRMRLQYNAYDQWTQSYRVRLDEKHLHTKAIMHWAWQLEKKCFLNWIFYIKERQAKKSRYDRAIHDRQVCILKTSLQSLVKYSMDSKERRFKHQLQIKQQNILNLNQLAFKYYFLWKEKSLNQQEFKCKVKSLGDTEKVMPKRPAVFTDTPPVRVTNRPQPRKPSFLLESLNRGLKSPDVSVEDTNSVLKRNDVPFEDTKTVQKVPLLNLEDQENRYTPACVDSVQPKYVPKPLYDSNIKPMLMPPSAFTTIAPQPIVPKQSPTSNRSQYLTVNTTLHHGESRCSSVSTLTPNLSDDLSSLNKNLHNISETIEKDYELIKLKQRMESLALYKQKLKTLKEQERLLDNCVNTPNMTNTSISETLFHEIDQIKKEIHDITAFMKTEKRDVQIALKKYKIV